MKFSNRYNHIKQQEHIQTTSLDQTTRLQLWNKLYEYIWSNTKSDHLYQLDLVFKREHPESISVLNENIWNLIYQRPIDLIPTKVKDILEEHKEYILSAEWYFIYDFLEFIIRQFGNNAFKIDLTSALNKTLESNLCGYKIIGSTITPIIEEIEAKEISIALNNRKTNIKTHINDALKLLSDRRNPNYRNSIKESISAIEACVKSLSDHNKDNKLSTLLGRLKSNYQLHEPFLTALNKLYAYTSDSGGIRHSLDKKENLDLADAKFFLIICSAFVNYLQSKLPTPDQ